MNTYTIYWTPEQQAAFLTACPFINPAGATWYSTGTPPYFELIQNLNPAQYASVLAECQATRIMGIKPGSNPGGSPTGCA